MTMPQRRNLHWWLNALGGVAIVGVFFYFSPSVHHWLVDRQGWSEKLSGVVGWGVFVVLIATYTEWRSYAFSVRFPSPDGSPDEPA